MTTQQSLEARGVKFVRNDDGKMTCRAYGEELKAEVQFDVARRVTLFVDVMIRQPWDPSETFGQYKIAEFEPSWHEYGQCHHCGEPKAAHLGGACALCESAVLKAMVIAHWDVRSDIARDEWLASKPKIHHDHMTIETKVAPWEK